MADHAVGLLIELILMVSCLRLGDLNITYPDSPVNDCGVYLYFVCRHSLGTTVPRIWENLLGTGNVGSIQVSVGRPVPIVAGLKRRAPTGLQ